MKHIFTDTAGKLRTTKDRFQPIKPTYPSNSVPHAINIKEKDLLCRLSYEFSNLPVVLLSIGKCK